VKARVLMFTDVGSAQLRGPDLFLAWGKKSGQIRAGFPAGILKVGSSFKRTLSLKEIAFKGIGCKESRVWGIRGGSWNNDATNLRVSDRNNAGNTNADRNNNYGFRAARTTCRLATLIKGSSLNNVTYNREPK